MKKRNNKCKGMTGDINLIRNRIFANKTSFHTAQATLPFPEKIRLLIELQKIANTIKAKPGKKAGFVWKI